MADCSWVTEHLNQNEIEMLKNLKSKENYNVKNWDRKRRFEKIEILGREQGYDKENEDEKSSIPPTTPLRQRPREASVILKQDLVLVIIPLIPPEKKDPKIILKLSQVGRHAGKKESS